eukprot:1509240-Rhodomonas_salina.3
MLWERARDLLNTAGVTRTEEIRRDGTWCIPSRQPDPGNDCRSPMTIETGLAEPAWEEAEVEILEICALHGIDQDRSLRVSEF